MSGGVKSSPIRRAVGWISTVVDHRPGLCILVGIFLAIPAIWLTSQLHIDQNFRRLLPDDAVEVKRLDATDHRIGNQSDLVLAIRSPSRDANIAFGTRLANALRERKDLELRYVTFERDADFFEKNALLYASLADLLDLRERVRERIKKSVSARLSLGLDEASEQDKETDDDALSESNIRERYNLENRLREYMEAEDGRIVVIQARPDWSASKLDYSRRLTRSIEALVEELNPQAAHPELTVSIEGTYAENTRRARSMQNAVLQGTLACLAILLLSIGFYFRSGRAVFWILAPLVVSVFGALGFAQLGFGHLNLVSAFIFAILLGLGIDFGVHILSRYRDERARGLSRGDALLETLSNTGLSTAAGALSTAGCFVVLSASKFQGFAQFGLVAAVGVLFALAAAFVLLPALVAFTGGRGEHHFGARGKEHPPASKISTKLPVVSLLILGFAVAGTVFGAVKVGDIGFEYDFSKLGPDPAKRKKKAPEKGALVETGKDQKDWRRALGQSRETAPAIILTDDLDETALVHRQLATLLAQRKKAQATETAGSADAGAPVERKAKFKALREKSRRAGEPTAETQAVLARYAPERIDVMRDRINSVFSIYDFVPSGQEDKLVIIRDIKKRIDRKRKILSAKDQEDVANWDHYLEVDSAFGVHDLPQWVKDRMTDRQGRLGQFVIFWALGPKADYENAKRIRDAFFDVKTADGQAPSAAEYYVLPAIIDAIRDDGPRVTVLVTIVMFFAAWMLLGGLRGPLIILATVGVALTWLAAIMYLFGWKANLFNLIALPLLVGMGQDDALHLYHRYSEGGPGSLRRAVRETGSAILLTTWTTAVGFSGIFFANHRGLVSMAQVAVTGVFLCWFSSVLVLPAALRVMEWQGQRRIGTNR